VNVGRVTNVQPRGVDSLVTMNIQRTYAPIAANTRAILRTKTLLGEAYVMLSPGSRTAPKLPDGGTLPASQVQRAQELDQVLNSFTPPVQHNLEALLTGTANAFAGRGQDLNDAFGNFDPALSELAAIVGVLNQQHANVKALVAGGSTVLNTLSSRRADLQSLATAGNQVLSATAARNAQLQATIKALPPFLSQLRRSLGILNTSLSLAHPSLSALRPAVPLLAPALRGLDQLSVPALQLLSQAPAVLRAAEMALPAVTRFSTAFRPAVDTLLKVAGQISPIINLVYEYPRELVTGMANLGALLIARAPADTPSGTAAYLRAMVTIGPDSTYGQNRRAPGYRGNTYFAPGELSNMSRGGLEASSCSNVHDPSQSAIDQSNVACRLQPAFKWGHGVLTRYFPRLHALRPQS
jgi:virulence factor Mce-like protein